MIDAYLDDEKDFERLVKMISENASGEVIDGVASLERAWGRVSDLQSQVELDRITIDNLQAEADNLKRQLERSNVG